MPLVHLSELPTHLGDHSYGATGARYIAPANAYLIAAAPELLDFVQRWADIVQGGDRLETLEGWAQDMVIEARAAIARAKGKS